MQTKTVASKKSRTSMYGPTEQARREQRQIEVVAVGATEHGDDLQAEDREAPEDEEVQPAGEYARARSTTSGRMNFFCPNA